MDASLVTWAKSTADNYTSRYITMDVQYKVTGRTGYSPVSIANEITQLRQGLSQIIRVTSIFGKSF